MPTSPDSNWHLNIENLAYIEMQSNSKFSGMYPTSSQEKFTAFGKDRHDAAEKADPEKSFFAVCLRVGFLCSKDMYESRKRSLTSFIQSYRYGGKTLRQITISDMMKALDDPKKIIPSVIKRQSHIHGMLLNSKELAGLLLINQPVFNISGLKLDYSYGLRAPEFLTQGNYLIGISSYCGKNSEVHLPYNIRCRHILVHGLTGSGKTTLLMRMLLNDIINGFGIVFIDLVGEATANILPHIPDHRMEDVIYIDPTISEATPQMNFCEASDLENAGKLADDYVQCLSSISDHWGVKMHALLQEAIQALLITPETCFADLITLFSNTHDGNALRKRIIDSATDQYTRTFWKSEYYKYTKGDLTPIKTRLIRLLRSNPQGTKLFHQRENLINLEQALNSNKIILLNLPSGILGNSTASLCGSFMMALFHKTIISRAKVPERLRVPSFWYIDEFQKFMPGDIEAIMTDARRYNVGLNIFHHTKGQLKPHVETALNNANTYITFKLDGDNTPRAAKELMGLVDPFEIQRLNTGSAFMKCKDSVVNFRTKKFVYNEDSCKSQAIINRSVAQYYCKTPDSIFSQYTESSNAGGDVSDSGTKKRDYDRL